MGIKTNTAPGGQKGNTHEQRRKRGIFMNGFTMLADSYRKLMNDGTIDKESAEKHIRIYEFLETCDKEDFCIMLDSSAFNDILRECVGVDMSKVSTQDIMKVRR